jgi:hypothetical protein
MGKRKGEGDGEEGVVGGGERGERREMVSMRPR